jgi:hypothetical protein
MGFRVIYGLKQQGDKRCDEQFQPVVLRAWEK